MRKIRGFAKDVEKTRTIEFVFSDETKDSYRTVFTATGWDLDRFNKNGIALYNHNAWSSDPDVAIGSARAWIEGKSLLGSITFEPADLNPVADKVFRKYLAGTFKGVSIRFNPLERGQYGIGDEAIDGRNPTYYIGKRELVEISCVPIPSNKNALTRSFGEELNAELSEGEGFFTRGEVRLQEVEEPEAEKPEEEENEERTDTSTDNTEDEYLRVAAEATRALSN